MIRRVLLACVVTLLTTLPAHAQEITESLHDQLHAETFSVSIDGVQVSNKASVYLSDDGTVYVSSADLNAWRLRHPPDPDFQRRGLFFYGLQTTLGLAVSFDKTTRQLEIVGRPGAFRGQPVGKRPPLSPGHGHFMNYSLTPQTGSYDFYDVVGRGIFQMRYLSTTGNGLEFHRSQTRWTRFDPVHHNVLSIGEATADGSWLGNSTPYAGVHWASDFTTDPAYEARGLPSVSGIASSPSTLEVYVDNVLELTRDVPEGPFTVRDLPASAAHSDIVMVLTDGSGNRTVQVVRPSYDLQFLSRGKSTYTMDAGIGRKYVNEKRTDYSGAVFMGTFRYGFSDNVTGEAYTESIANENFADVGADVQLGANQTFAFRVGGGNRRHSSEYRFDLALGKFTFKEDFRFNSLRSQPLPAETFDNAVSEISETSELGISLNGNWTAGLRFNRSRSNQGSNSSMLSGRIGYRAGPFELSFSPFYDFIERLPSGNIEVGLRLSDIHRVRLKSDVAPSGETSAALEYRKDSANPSDPLSWAAQLSANRSQDRQFSIADDLKWASANFAWQQQYQSNLYEPQLQGALALFGGHFYALRTIGESDSIGVVHLPGLKNVPITVNGADVGRTNSRGNLLVQSLSPYRDNVVGVSEQDLPLGVNIANPLHVVPAAVSPVSLTFHVLSRGGFTLNVVDETGTPLAAGSKLVGSSRNYTIGYDGRAYITGLPAGPQQLSSSANGVPCVVQITVPADVTSIPDIGRQVCRSAQLRRPSKGAAQMQPSGRVAHAPAERSYLPIVKGTPLLPAGPPRM